MAEQNYGNSQASYVSEMGARLRDLEDKQRMLKERLILIGQNLIETKEKTNNDLLQIKKDLQIMNSTMMRLVSFLEAASSEFSKFARREDLEILSKQAKMFQPSFNSTKKDLKK